MNSWTINSIDPSDTSRMSVHVKIGDFEADQELCGMPDTAAEITAKLDAYVQDYADAMAPAPEPEVPQDVTALIGIEQTVE